MLSFVVSAHAWYLAASINRSAVMNLANLSSVADTSKLYTEGAAAVVALGDLDGNRQVDVAFGFPNYGLSGAVSICRMGVLGAPAKCILAHDGVFDLSISQGAQFGTSGTLVPDVDPAQFPILAVGAPGELAGNGVVRLLKLAMKGNSVAKVFVISNSTATPISETGFGSALAAADMDGDGRQELFVGTLSSTSPVLAAALYIFKISETDVVAIHAVIKGANLPCGGASSLSSLLSLGRPPPPSRAPERLAVGAQSCATTFVLTIDLSGAVTDTLSVNCTDVNCGYMIGLADDSLALGTAVTSGWVAER